MDDCYLDLKNLSKYSGLSISFLKRKLGINLDTIRYFNTGGKILIKKSEFDKWLETHCRVGGTIIETTKIQHIADEICNGLEIKT